VGCVLHFSLPSFCDIWLVNVAWHAYFQYLLVYTSNVEHESHIQALGVDARQHLHSVRTVIQHERHCILPRTAGWIVG